MTAGPVVPTPRARAALAPLPLAATRLDEGGFLGTWQRVNREATIPHCLAHLESEGALDNLRRAAKGGTGGFRGMWFADSDVHKTLEAVAWALGSGPDDDLTDLLDRTTALLAEAQADDGYLQSWYQVERPDQAWRDLAWGHEMYCAGHLVQAGVAAARTVGHAGLLDVARRAADLLVRRFGEEPDGEGHEGYGGHPEVETALVELFRLTGEDAYLRLASRLVEGRGRGLLDAARFGPRYFQDHAPVREATEATGHAVRQLYLAAGVTDVAVETGDDDLLAAAEALWEDVVATKSYVTGGLGSRHRDEAFGDAYALPPDRAYAETCAAIAQVMLSWRLLLATGRGRYADEMERVLLNAVAVSASADGRAFTYANPLHVRPGHATPEDSGAGRRPWFTCACCPPNVARLVASLQHYVATTDTTGVQLHLYAAATVRATVPDGGPVTLDVATDHPWDGRVTVTVAEGRGPWTLSLRVPGWCDGARLTVAGETLPATPDENGYVRLRRDWHPGDTVVLDLPMPVRLLRAHPRVDAVRGCVALVRGPLVHCVEDADVEPGVAVDDLRLDPAAPPEAVTVGDVPGLPDLPGVPVVLRGRAVVEPPAPGAPLYADAVGGPAGTLPRAQGSPDSSDGSTTFTAVPYLRRAHRGPGALRVWIPTPGSAP